MTWVGTKEFENFKQKREEIVILEVYISAKDVKAEYMGDMLELNFFYEGHPQKLEKLTLDDFKVIIEIVDKESQFLNSCLLYNPLDCRHIVFKNIIYVFIHQESNQGVPIDLFRQPLLTVEFVNASDMRFRRAKVPSHYNIIYPSHFLGGNEEFQFK